MPPARPGDTGSAASMRFGVTIPNNWGIADPRQVLALGPLAEALGCDSVWVTFVSRPVTRGPRRVGG